MNSNESHSVAPFNGTQHGQFSMQIQSLPASHQSFDWAQGKSWIPVEFLMQGLFIKIITRLQEARNVGLAPVFALSEQAVG